MQEHICFCHTVTLQLSSSSSALTLIHTVTLFFRSQYLLHSPSLHSPFPTLCHQDFSTLSPFSPFTFSLTLFLCNSWALSLSFIIFHILYFFLPLSDSPTHSVIHCLSSSHSLHVLFFPTLLSLLLSLSYSLFLFHTLSFLLLLSFFFFSHTGSLTLGSGWVSITLLLCAPWNIASEKDVMDSPQYKLKKIIHKKVFTLA